MGRLKKVIRIASRLGIVVGLVVLMIFLGIYTGEIYVTEFPWRVSKAKQVIKSHLRDDLGIVVMHISTSVSKGHSSMSANGMMTIYDDHYEYNLYYGNYLPDQPKYWRHLILDKDLNIVKDELAFAAIAEFMDKKITGEIGRKVSPANVNFMLGGNVIHPQKRVKYKDCFSSDTSDDALAYELNKECRYEINIAELDYNGCDKADVWWEIFMYMHEKGLKPQYFSYKDERRYLPELEYDKGKAENIEKIREWIRNSSNY